jgi:hypothetical protein
MNEYISSETFLILRGIPRGIIDNVRTSSCKASVILSDFNKTSIFSTFEKYSNVNYFMKTRPVGAELFHAYGRADTDTTKLTATFRNFVPKKMSGLSVCVAKFEPTTYIVQSMTVGQSTAKFAILSEQEDSTERTTVRKGSVG